VIVPGQVCQKKLPDLPVKVIAPMVVVLNGFLVFCGNPVSDFVCYQFDKANTGNWVLLLATTSQNDHTNHPGVVLSNKLYAYSDKAPEIYDPIAAAWSPWEKPSLVTGGKACMTVASKKIYLIGGQTSIALQVYDPTGVNFINILCTRFLYESALL